MFSLVQKDSGYGNNFALTPKDTNNNGDTILVSYGFFTMIKPVIFSSRSTITICIERTLLDQKYTGNTFLGEKFVCTELGDRLLLPTGCSYGHGIFEN